MDIRQFLLWMTFTRIACMVVLIWWLLFTESERRRIIAVVVCVCLYMLSSNLIQASVALLVLEVKPW